MRKGHFLDCIGDESMSKESDSYEELVHLLINKIRDAGRDIRELKYGRKNVLLGKSGQEHQIDVSFWDHSFTLPKLVLIECKQSKEAYERNTEIDVVRIALAKKFDIILSLPDSSDGWNQIHFIIASTQRFSSGAQRFSKFYGIQLETVSRGPEYRFQYDNCTLRGILESAQGTERVRARVVD